MICLFARRRLGAHLDGALDAGAARAVVQHLDGCVRCRQEADGLRRLTVLLRQAKPVAPGPDWAGFWPGVVRGIQNGATRSALVERRRWSRRWVLGGAVVTAAAVLSVVVAYERLVPSGLEESVVVTAAQTQYPGGTMVYHEPDKVAVVWVFDE